MHSADISESKRGYSNPTLSEVFGVPLSRWWIDGNKIPLDLPEYYNVFAVLGQGAYGCVVAASTEVSTESCGCWCQSWLRQLVAQLDSRVCFHSCLSNEAVKVSCQRWLSRVTGKSGYQRWLPEVAARSGCQRWLSEVAVRGNCQRWLSKLAAKGPSGQKIYETKTQTKFLLIA